AYVERRVQFDDVQRPQAASVGDHFHAQLRFAIGGAAGNAGGDRRRDFRIEEVDVETDVQVGIGRQAGQRFFHDGAHADLVDGAHVVDFDAGGGDQALFAFVDTAYADLADPVGLQRRRMSGQAGERLGAVAAQAGHRHAVQVAGRGERLGVEVGM